MNNESSSSCSSRSHNDSDPGSESDHDVDDLRDAVQSAVVGGANSIAVGAGSSSSASGQLAIHYDVTQFVTDYDAINVFGLKKKQLRRLNYQKRHIPGICRQGMRMGLETALYNRSDIEAAAKENQEAVEAKQQARRNRQLEKQRRRKRAAGAAKDQVLKFSGCKRARSSSDAAEKHGDVKLPDAVLQTIIGCLAAFEPDGVRGPSMVARDLANATLVSWDFHNAAKHEFTLLLQQIQQLTIKPIPYGYGLENGLRCLPAESGWSWQQWAAFLSDPLSFKLPELKLAAEQLQLFKTGTKAELIVKLLGAFGLKAPSKAPPQLLRALALERMSIRPWLGCEALLEPHEALFTLCMLCGREDLVPGISRQQLIGAKSAAAWRQLLLSIGVESKAQLLQLKERVVSVQGEVVTALAREMYEAHDFSDSEEHDVAVPTGDIQAEAA